MNLCVRCCMSSVSEEVIQKQMKLTEVAMGKAESELSHHKKSDQDKFHEKMKVWTCVCSSLLYCTCLHVYCIYIRMYTLHSDNNIEYSSYQCMDVSQKCICTYVHTYPYIVCMCIYFHSCANSLCEYT